MIEDKIVTDIIDKKKKENGRNGSVICSNITTSYLTWSYL